MADIEQEEKEAPGKFLDRLREALRRFTEIDPESEEGKVILKDRFITQSAPDIRHKLQKWAYGPNQSLDTPLQLAQMVYYGREYEGKKKGKERPRKRRTPSQWQYNIKKRKHYQWVQKCIFGLSSSVSCVFGCILMCAGEVCHRLGPKPRI